MILVTGATGHLGQAVIDYLLQTVPANSITALVRDENKALHLKAKGIQLRVGDYHQKEVLENALIGVDQLLLISSSDFNNRLQQHQNVVDAAVKNKVKHIYYTGVSMNAIENSPLKPYLADHFQTEDYIKASGLYYTFLRHSLYADVVPLFLGEQVIQTGVYFAAGDGKVSFAVREDLAEAIAKIITGAGHENKTYPLTNSVTYSFADVAQYLSELAEKKVDYTSPSPEDFVLTLKSFGLPEPIIAMSAAFAAGIQHNDFDQPYPDLSQILGRTPTDLKTFLSKTYFAS